MGKTAFIVILYNQLKHWDRLKNAIESQSHKPDEVIVVVDNYKKEELLVLNDIDIHITIIETDKVEYFTAARNRNIGLEKAIKLGCDNFIFIDGDCIPQRDLIFSHIKKLDSNNPVLTCGRRREKQYNWNDQREILPNLTHLRLFSGNGLLISNPELLKQCLIVWSCNIGLNISAVNYIKKFNLKYYGRNELFNSDYDKWGGEDSFLGIIAWYCRVFITTLPEKTSGVEHIEHPRPDVVYNKSHKDQFDSMCDILKKKVMLNPLDITFFNS